MITRSIISLVQSFDSVIQQGESSMKNEENIICISPYDTDDDDSPSIRSHSLYSVMSDYM